IRCFINARTAALSWSATASTSRRSGAPPGNAGLTIHTESNPHRAITRLIRNLIVVLRHAEPYRVYARLRVVNTRFVPLPKRFVPKVPRRALAGVLSAVNDVETFDPPGSGRRVGDALRFGGWHRRQRGAGWVPG